MLYPGPFPGARAEGFALMQPSCWAQPIPQERALAFREHTGDIDAPQRGHIGEVRFTPDASVEMPFEGLGVYEASIV